MKNRGEAQTGLVVALVVMIFVAAAAYFLYVRRVDMRKTEVRREVDAARQAEQEKCAVLRSTSAGSDRGEAPKPPAETPAAPAEGEENIEDAFSAMRRNLETDAPAAKPGSKLCESLKKVISEDSSDKDSTEGCVADKADLDKGKGGSEKIVVQLYLKDLKDVTLKQIKAAGAEVLLKSTAPDMVVARIEKEKLQSLASIGDVWFVDFNFEHHDAIKKGELRGIDGEKVK